MTKIEIRQAESSAINPRSDERGDEKSRYVEKYVDTKIAGLQWANFGVVKHNHQHSKAAKGLDINARGL